MRNASLLLLGLVVTLAAGCQQAGTPRRNVGEVYLDAVERWDNGTPPNRVPANRPLAAELANTRPSTVATPVVTPTTLPTTQP